MQVTDAMLQAAVKKAVEEKLLPKYSAGEDQYIKSWESVKAVVQAALDASVAGD